jgi:hypothetical protein
MNLRTRHFKLLEFHYLIEAGAHLTDSTKYITIENVYCFRSGRTEERSVLPEMQKG